MANADPNSGDLEAGIFLFMKTLYDFTPYLRNPDEQEKLIHIPKNVKIILREIITSKIFSTLILDNEYKKAEEKRKEKMRRIEERKRQLIEGTKPVQIQDENYENNLKLLKNKRSLNTSCFNQRSISTLNQYYYSVNEMLCIRDTVLNKIKKVERDSFISCIELEKKNKIVHDKFVFMNPKNKNKILQALSMPKMRTQYNDKSKYKTSGHSLNDNDMLTRGFMSLDNYYKFIKNNLKKINEYNDKSNNNMTESLSKANRKTIKLYDANDNKEREMNRIKNRFMFNNTDSNRILLPDLKRNPINKRDKNLMNFVLFNKDVKYQVKKSNNNNKKNASRDKHFLNYTDFDYKNILSLFK